MWGVKERERENLEQVFTKQLVLKHGTADVLDGDTKNGEQRKGYEQERK